MNLGKYLGKAWVAGSTGPDSFDCWGLLVDIYREQLGIKLPLNSDIDRNLFKDISKRAVQEIDRCWEPLLFPMPFCAVGISDTSKRIFHVGCYIEKDDGLVLHSKRNTGVIAEPLSKLKANYKYVSFYGHNS